jgi:molybdate transport system regulatory protein
LEGTISSVDERAVSQLVAVTLPDGAVVSATVTNDAVEALPLKVGQPVTTVFKAQSVIVAAKA